MRRHDGLILLTLWAAASAAWGQFDLQRPGLEGFADRKPTGVRHSLVADVTSIVPGQTFHIGISFEVEKGSYFYYKTPGTSGGRRTLVQFRLPPGFQVGESQFPAPEVKHETIKEPMVFYVYPKSTVIFAEVKAPADLKVGEKVEIKAEVGYLFCDKESCRIGDDKNLRLELPIAATTEPSAASKQFQAAKRSIPGRDVNEPQVVRVEPYLNVDALKPNASALLALDLWIDEGFHIQPHRPSNPDAVPTEIIVDLPDGIEFSAPLFPEPLAALHPLEGFEGEKEFRGRATVTVPLASRRFLQPGEAVISGFVRYQPCNESGCLPPTYAPFRLVVPVVSEETAVNTTNSPVFASAPLPPASGADVRADPGIPAETNSKNFELIRTEELDGGLAKYLLYAFLGGLILNIMPCVLPVIAIKVLSFVNQAGENRFQIFLLNATYSAGVIFVFLVLASLAAFAQVGWGELFQSPEFNLAIASVVFAMGLSLLGVFEIPVPGFAGTIDTAKKEGPLGAFLTGILATLLATPCSGPFMGVTLTWSLQQPTATIFAVWGMMGLGMASPYILCGLFPSLVKFLPKPGMWMVRFKELAGFVLMATVVYIVSFLNDAYVLPLLVILLGVAVAIWMTSNLYTINSSFGRKLQIRTLAFLIAIGTVVAALGYFKPLAKSRQDEAFERRLAQMQIERPQDAVATTDQINWVPFTEANFNRYRDEGRTIFIDFTADWCLICKWNEANAIDTSPVRDLMDQYGVVALKADYTDRSPEIKDWMARFGHQGGVPYYVVVSGKNSSKAIVFDGQLSQNLVLDKLRQAGPSVASGGQAASPAVSMAR